MATVSAQLDVKVAATSAVCEEAELQGTISIGRQCVVHPKCQIRASAVPIVIGDRNILEDRVVLESSADVLAPPTNNNSTTVMVVGTDNLFESGCSIRSSHIGNGNWFEPKAQVHEGSVIGNNCIIGSGVIIEKHERVPDNTVIVCVADAHGNAKRILRQQKDYLLKARENLVQKYIDTFLDTKSMFALEKNHRLVAVLPANP